MPTATLTKVSRDANGRVRIRIGGHREREFASIADARDFAAGQLTVDALDAVVIALLLTRQPNLSNPAALEGHTVTVDFTLANWGTVS